MDELVARLARQFGIPPDSLIRVGGWSNEVWLNDDRVIRVSSGRFKDSFSHDAAVCGLVADRVNVPSLLAEGIVQGREWMIQVRCAGEPVSNCWKVLSPGERKALTRELGAALKAIHETPLPPGFANPWISSALSEGKGSDLYLVAPADFEVLLAAADAEGKLSPQLISLLSRYFEAHADAFADDGRTLIHGDIHGDNLLWDGSTLTVLDFELATVAHPDRELQQIHDSFPELLPGLADAYPELQQDSTRQEVYAMLRAVHQAWRAAPGEQDDPRPYLEETASR